MRKMMRLYLVGMLSGVMLAAAFTYMFALPANDYRWQSEIWERGGGAFTMDMKTGRTGWKWLVEPKSDVPIQKRVIEPPSVIKVRAEQL